MLYDSYTRADFSSGSSRYFDADNLSGKKKIPHTYRFFVVAAMAAELDLVPGLLSLLLCLDIALLKKLVKMETIMIRRKTWLQTSSS